MLRCRYCEKPVDYNPVFVLTAEDGIECLGPVGWHAAMTNEEQYVYECSDERLFEMMDKAEGDLTFAEDEVARAEQALYRAQGWRDERQRQFDALQAEYGRRDARADSENTARWLSADDSYWAHREWAEGH